MHITRRPNLHPNDPSAIAPHFLPENNPEWRGLVFGTLRPDYPQLPSYGDNCRRITAKLAFEQPKSFTEALDLIADGMNQNYKPLLSKHAQEGSHDFGRMRTTQDLTTWPWSMVPRYAYATDIIRKEYAEPIAEAKAKRRASSLPLAVAKEMDGLCIGHFSIRETQHPMGYSEINFHIPALGSVEWVNCKRLCDHHYQRAMDAELPQAERLESAFKCYQTFSCWAPFERGSSTTAMVLLAHMVESMGLTLPPQAEGCDLNVTSISTPFETFYENCKTGEYFTRARTRDELQQCSRRIAGHNQAKESLRTQGVLWSEILGDLHSAHATQTAPTFWGHSKLCHYDITKQDEELSIPPVILNDGQPGLRINSELMYNVIHSSSSMKFIQASNSPVQLPAVVDMAGNWHDLSRIDRYAAMSPEETQEWRERTYDVLANALQQSEQKGFRRA
jgi:hypothetical protein